MGRDLVEPEGVNAGSADTQREAGPPGGDPVAGGDVDAGPAGPEPADEVLGAPPEPAGDVDGVFGAEPPA